MMNKIKRISLVMAALLLGNLGNGFAADDVTKTESTKKVIKKPAASKAKPRTKTAAAKTTRKKVTKKAPVKKSLATSANTKVTPKAKKPRVKKASVAKKAPSKSVAKKAPTRRINPALEGQQSAPALKTTPKAAPTATQSTGLPSSLPIRVKDLAGLSTEASHTHTYASVAKRIADSGERTNSHLTQVLRDTARGQAPDSQELAGIAANYHNLGNFVEALSTSSPENVHKLMLETPNLKPLAHYRK